MIKAFRSKLVQVEVRVADAYNAQIVLFFAQFVFSLSKFRAIGCNALLLILTWI